MWRSTFTIFRKIIFPSVKENANLTKIWYSTKSWLPKSTPKLALVSTTVGVLMGTGYGFYTHYKINTKSKLIEQFEYAFLKDPPEYKPHYRVTNDSDTSNLQLILFQYRTCPFCCKVRAYLDSKGVSYEIVEVDAVLRQAIKWSGYKKVPILLVKVDGGYQQLQDSTAIISILETYLRDASISLREVIKFYPSMRFENDNGKEILDITNKYFIMHYNPTKSDSDTQNEERKWRQWADSVLVHTLSPNVYRTAGEALETFKWFEDVGGWRQSFPTWECALMVYGGAMAMWIIAKRLKTRYHIKDDVRQSLYDAANEWTTAVRKKGARFLGGDKPNLADITVYGVLSSIEGCQAFQDLWDNTEIGKWYNDVKNTIGSRQGKLLAVAAQA